MPGSCGRKKGHGKTNQDLLDRGRYERCSTTARVGNTEHQMQPKKRNVFLLKANIIGYFRIVLILLALRVREQPELFLCLFSMSFILDAIDGAVARYANEFGAWLDIVTDNFSRSILWMQCLPPPLAIIPVTIEFTVMSITQRGGKAWKEDFFVNAPSWVLLIMRNNFRTPLGGLAVLGLFGMPLWLCSLKFLFNTWFSSPIFGAVFTLGRFVALLVEMWILIKHVRSLAQADRESGCYA